VGRHNPTKELSRGSAKVLLEDLTTTHPNLNRLRIKNLYEGNDLWLGEAWDGSDAIDVTVNLQITGILQQLLHG